MTAKTTKAAGQALADKLGARAAGLSTSQKRVSEMTDDEVRSLAMPLEAPKPPGAYSARISHTTTPAQLEALEALRMAEKASGKGAVSITALLRAMTAICLDDRELREQVVSAARSPMWR